MKKLIVCIVFLCLFVQYVCADGTQPSGSGTSGSPYIISTLNHLLWISTNPTSWDKVFVQTADIDASSTATWNSNSGWSLIGNGSNPFTGTYNGGGFTISGLTISRAEHVQGFFGATGNASISNLTLSDVSISITGDQEKCGALVAQNVNTTVSNCHASGTVKGDDYVGGLIGMNSGAAAVISDCSFNGTVARYANYSGNNMGGLIGSNESGAQIEDSYAIATVSGKWYAGGLTGKNDASTITRCYFTGTTFGDYYVGGLVGYNNNSSTINKSYSEASASAYTNNAGGITGSNNNSTIRNCYSRGSVSRSQGTEGNFGSFIGNNQNTSVIEYCYSTGAVTYIGTTDPTDKGFIGNYNATGCLHNFFDTGTSLQSGGAGATPTSTEDMKDYSTFISDDWDFKGESTNGTDETWNIGNSRNDGYPYFDWEYPSDESPLSITLSSFTAEEQEGMICLRWISESEIENSGYIVERKTPSSDWVKLDDYISDSTLVGHGTSSETHEYSYLDRNVIPNTYYYRISDVNYQGHITVHEPISITIEEVGITVPIEFGLIATFPNPFNPILTIHYGLTEDANTVINIFNLQGQEVSTLKNEFQKVGSYELQWNAWNQASGIYIVKISAGKNTDFRKVSLLK